MDGGTEGLMVGGCADLFRRTTPNIATGLVMAGKGPLVVNIIFTIIFTAAAVARKRERERESDGTGILFEEPINIIIIIKNPTP